MSNTYQGTRYRFNRVGIITCFVIHWTAACGINLKRRSLINIYMSTKYIYNTTIYSGEHAVRREGGVRAEKVVYRY